MKGCVHRVTVFYVFCRRVLSLALRGLFGKAVRVLYFVNASLFSVRRPNGWVSGLPTFLYVSCLGRF